MSVYSAKHLYRYIIERNGRYYIWRQNKCYGGFKKVETAMLERDFLEDCEWDEDRLIECEVVNTNRYEEMDLPPFTKHRNVVYDLPKHITFHRGKFRIQKCLNGRPVFFADFRNLKDAVSARDNLESHGWDKTYAFSTINDSMVTLEDFFNNGSDDGNIGGDDL